MNVEKTYRLHKLREDFKLINFERKRLDAFDNRMNKENHNNMRYVEDTTLLASNAAVLQNF